MSKNLNKYLALTENWSIFLGDFLVQRRIYQQLWLRFEQQFE